MLIALKVLEDNYTYFFFSKTEAIAFDVVEPEFVLGMLSLDFGDKKFQVVQKSELKNFKPLPTKRKLLKFFTTHRHLDHSGGDKFMKNHAVHFKIGEQNEVEIKVGMWTIKAIKTPCHTLDSVCFFVKNDDSKSNYIVTGDTLFYLGCGKFNEGSAEDMEKNFEKLRQLNGICLYGHDYNDTAIKFNEQYQKLPEEIKNKKFLTMNEEKKWNIFLNVKKAQTDLKTLRNLKNSFN